MKRVLVDSNVLIDVLRGDPDARDCVASELRHAELYGSVVTRAEILAGMLPGEETQIGAQLMLIRWLNVDETVADRAAEFSRRHRKKHPGIDLADYLIAATADLAGLRVLTRNVKHFPMFPRLKPAY